jgi:ribosomal protein S18 acetylase RimI-like enzyme
MKLRLAAFNDAAAIAALHAASWQRTYKDALSQSYLEHKALAERQALWRQRFESPQAQQCVLVADNGGQVAGFTCAFGADHPQWGSYLDNLHVHPSYQGQGLGKALLIAAAQWCEQRSPGLGLYLFVNQSNHSAQQLYLALGARNAEPEVWHAPDGSLVPTYRFAWASAAALASQSAPLLPAATFPLP